jgi:hypothetical protein
VSLAFHGRAACPATCQAAQLSGIRDIHGIRGVTGDGRASAAVLLVVMLLAAAAAVATAAAAEMSRVCRLDFPLIHLQLARGGAHAPIGPAVRVSWERHAGGAVIGSGRSAWAGVWNLSTRLPAAFWRAACAGMLGAVVLAAYAGLDTITRGYYTRPLRAAAAAALIAATALIMLV